MSEDRKKQLVLNFIDFLRTSEQDGTIKEDDKESLEVAIQCLAESFGVDPDSAEDQAKYSIKPASLLSLLEVLSKTKNKSTGATPAAAASSSAAPTPEASAAQKKEAEALKAKGNSLMSQKQYNAAIEQYTEAIKLDPNPVFYSNRAAAWSGLGDHQKAVEDAERAIDLDPKFAKGYSRLGHAQFCLGNYQEAVDAYEDGLKVDPSNANMKASLATAKSRVGESSSSTGTRSGSGAGTGAEGGAGGMPDLASLANSLGGGGGGMPDIAAMMRNPQMMQMAQQMMANGGLERLMANPALRNMAENMQGGGGGGGAGGMPDFNALANDPSIRDLASQFFSGQGQGQGR